MTELSTSCKEWLSEYCVETIKGMKAEFEMVDAEIEKMKEEPRRCKMCDYERMVKSRHYVWETMRDVLAVHGAIK